MKKPNPEEPTRLSDLTPTQRCPECQNPQLKRTALPQLETSYLNGAALYTVAELCNICDWMRTVENVKLGA